MTEPAGDPAAPILALDIGGTKLAAGLVSPQGRLLASERVATPPGGDAETVYAAVEGLLERVRGDHVVAGLGVGCGGPMRWPAGEVSPLNIPGWRDFPLRSRLQAWLPGHPVRLHNDALAYAAAEHWQGGGRGAGSLLAVVVSTGVGGGIISAGRLLDGRSGNAGHVGHLVVEPGGPLCGCGGRGCLEAVARGPAVVEWARERGWAAGSDGRALAASAASGDPVALAAFARAGAAVGMALAGAAAVLDVERIVVGGGLTAAGEPFVAPLRRAYADAARLGFTSGIPVHTTSLSEPGVIGAAALIACGDRYWSPSRGQ